MIIIIVLLLGSSQLAYSQSSTSSAKERRRCYTRDRRFYLEYFSMAADSTFVHEAWLSDRQQATGRWEQVGDSLYLTYNFPDSAQTFSSRLGIYPKYLIKNDSLLPITPDKKGKPRVKTRWSEIWVRGECMDNAPKP